MLGVLPFGEDPDLSGTAGPAVPQHLPPCTVLIMPKRGGSGTQSDCSLWCAVYCQLNSKQPLLCLVVQEVTCLHCNVSHPVISMRVRQGMHFLMQDSRVDSGSFELGTI